MLISAWVYFGSNYDGSHENIHYFMKSCLKKRRLEFSKWEMEVIDLGSLIYVIFNIGYHMIFRLPDGI